MVKWKSIEKLARTLAILFAVLFCLDAVAVDNPVSYDTGITDCDVIKYNGEYYIQGNWLKGDMLASRDLLSWGERKHVFSWSNSWHTKVTSDPNPDYDIHGTHIRYLNGEFHLYAHLDVSDGIAYATASDIWGPYIEQTTSAPFSDSAGRWIIDADTFLDEDGSLYYYETDRQGSSGHEIRARTMSNPSTLSGSWDFQIQDSQSWEGSVINEGSKVFKYRNRYYMLYNGEGTGSPDYAVGCVESSTPLGFDNTGKYADNPVISRAVPTIGKPEITHIGQSWVVEGLNGFEKWFGYFAETTADGRAQRIDRMHFFDRKLFIDGPTDRYSPGYHPAPAKPQLLNIFSIADGSLPSNDWNPRAGTWSVTGEEALQSDQNAWAFNPVNRDAAANYLIEANLKFTEVQDAEDKAGVLAYYQDADNYVLVGFNRVADDWYVHVREGGVNTFSSGSYAGSIDYSVYHKIRVTKNDGTFDVRIDEMIPPSFSPVSTGFGAGTPGLFTDHTAAAFDGVIYTIGWDEFDSNVAGWGNSAGGLPMVGSRSYGSGGITVSSGLVYKGDLMPEYEFSAQVYQDSGTGSMGLAAVAIDSNNYLNAVINLATDKLVVSGAFGGVGFSESEVSVADQTDYNLRVVKLSDRVIVFVAGEEILTVSKAYGSSPVGLISTGMDARFTGIMAYRTESDIASDPWTLTDIGTPGFSGTAELFDHALYMTGSGDDIWDLDDEFSFAQKDISGDWEFTTRVIAHDRTHYWAKAGLMFRDSLATNSPMINLNVTPRDDGIGGVHLHWRDAVGSGTGARDVFDLQYPIWIKLKRVGSAFTGSYSSDGASWTELHTYTSPLQSAGKVGYSLCSVNNDRIAKAVFDNSTLVVPLTPGSIGNSQELYEDEDPAPFTSLTSATGTGAISYQWQWTLTPGDAGSWVDLAGATNETYTSPNLNGLFPANSEVFSHRKATDTASQEDDSNEVSLKLIAVFDTSGSDLFIDNFNTINTANMNWDYATRQAGGAGRSTYTDGANYSISNNALYCIGSGVSMQAETNFAHYIVGKDFDLSFKLRMDYTGVDWISIYLVDAGNSIWGANDFGVHALGPGNALAFYINDLSLNDGGNNLHLISESEVETALGLSPGGYDKTQQHTIQLISTVGVGGTNRYDFVVDGATIRTNLLYAFSDDTVRQIDFLSFFADGAPGGAYIDDIALRYPLTYTRWSADNNLAGADADRDADIEPDGLDNLLEYALGGNPNVNDAATFMPGYNVADAGGGLTLVNYVYNRRLNAASLGLTYGLNTSTNLLSTWTDIGTSNETGSVGIDSNFESVSNSVPFSTNEGFIYLKVTED